jgi:small-conductance mechanosensitive channel
VLSHLSLILGLRLNNSNWTTELVVQCTKDNFVIANIIIVVLFIFDFFLLLTIKRIFKDKVEKQKLQNKNKVFTLFSIIVIATMAVGFVYFFQHLLSNWNSQLFYVFLVLGFLFWGGLFFLKKEIVINHINLTNKILPSKIKIIELYEL